MSRERLSEINGLQPLVIEDIPYDEHEYKPSDIEGFQYVFTKDNLPTYHQMYDNFLHWNWNEYDNDPAKFESPKYISSVLDKVFIWINARLLGVINNGDNHSELVNELSNMINAITSLRHTAESFLPSFVLDDKTPLHYDFVEILALKRSELEGRDTPFTKNDAIVWWQKEDVNPLIGDATVKPAITTVFRLGGSDVTLTRHAEYRLYMMLFKYVIKYYNHVFGAKFQSTWVKLNIDDMIMIQTQEMAPLLRIGERLTTETSEYIKFMTKQIGDIHLEEGEILPIYISSDDGDMWDNHMNTFTQGKITFHNGEHYLSATRGFNVYQINGAGSISKEFIECLVAKGKNHEASRTEMWRDVMECGAVLFPMGASDELIIKIRITNPSKYKSEISSIMISAMCRQLEKIAATNKIPEAPTIEFSFGPDDAFYFDIQDLDIILALWGILEHTLDMWVQFGDRWSLICNISTKDSQFYADKPHIEHVNWDNMSTEFELPEGDLLSIIPRDGMTWSHITNMGINKHTYTNNTAHKKIYY